MPIDASIVNGLRPIQINDPLQQAGNVLALQGGMARNQLLGLQTRAAQQELVDKTETKNALAKWAQGGMTDEGLSEVAKASPTAYFNLLKERRAAKKETAETDYKQAQLDGLHLSRLDSILAPLAAKPNATPDEVIANLAIAADSGVPKKHIEAIIQHMPQNALQIPAYLKAVAGRTKEGLEAVKSFLVDPEFKDIGGSLQAFNKNPLAGPVGPVADVATVPKTLTPGEAITIPETQRHNKAIEGIQAGRLAVDQKRLANESDADFQARIAGAKAGATATAKATVGAEFSLPAARASMNRAITQVDELLKHPGFSSTVGATLLPGARFVPGTKQADFQARFDQIKGGSFLEAYNTLKGGGQITEVEGKKATDAINRMQLAQSEKEFRLAADDFKSAVRSGFAKLEAQASGKPAAANGGWSIQRVD